MRNRKLLITSLILSIFIHVVFIKMSDNITLINAIFKKPKEKRFFKVNRLSKDMTETNISNTIYSQKTNVLRFDSPANARMDEHNLSMQERMIEKIKNEDSEQLIEKSKIDINNFSKNVPDQDINYELLKKKAKKDTNQKIVQESEITENNVEASLGEFIEGVEIPEDFFEKMPGFTPSGTVSPSKLSGLNKMGIAGIFNNTSKVKRLEERMDLKSYLIHTLETYTDPKTSQKYFKLSLQVGPDSDQFEAAPKEVIFLIDCSQSITQKRLKEFIKGVELCLKQLKKNDKFNIYGFKQTIMKFSPESVEYSNKSFKEAVAFLNRLSIGTRTDTYNALLKSINESASMEPSYIILLSDGRPTFGITNPRKIINEISRINDSSRTFFAYSGGRNVNRYLLDFLTYKNRGWAEYAKRTSLIGRNMSYMFDKVRDPLLLKLRFFVTGVDKEDVYPKQLPDLFRNVEFNIYGKCSSENNFALQLVGEQNKKLTELIVEDTFENAQTGNKEIARNWAFNKIYYLIGQIQEGQNNKPILEEIKKLSWEYEIATPYFNQIRK